MLLKGTCNYGGPALAVSALLTLVVPVSASETTDTEASATRQLSVATYYSRGNYGESSATEVYFAPLTYQHTLAGWRLRASVPWLRISGPGSVLVNVGGVVRPDLPREDEEALLRQRAAAEGLGDVTLAAVWEMPAWSETAPFIDFALEVKLPTADEQLSLGTGAVDVAVQLDFYQQLGSNLVFSTVGYRFRGRSQWFDGLQDSAFISLGFTRPWPQQRLPGELSWGVIHDYRQAAATLTRATHEVLPYLSWSPQPQWSLMAYAVRGFSRDTPDHALGLQLAYNW